MKITILTYLESEDTKTCDVVVDQVAEALRQGGHKPSVLGVHGDLRKLIAGLSRRKPDLVFNLLEMFGRNVRGDVGVAGVLDLLGTSAADVDERAVDGPDDVGDADVGCHLRRVPGHMGFGANAAPRAYVQRQSAGGSGGAGDVGRV